MGWVFNATCQLAYPCEIVLLPAVGFSPSTWYALVSIIYTHSFMTLYSNWPHCLITSGYSELCGSTKLNILFVCKFPYKCCNSVIVPCALNTSSSRKNILVRNYIKADCLYVWVYILFGTRNYVTRHITHQILFTLLEYWLGIAHIFRHNPTCAAVPHEDRNRSNILVFSL
jgi:hypothetical protein